MGQGQPVSVAAKVPAQVGGDRVGRVREPVELTYVGVTEAGSLGAMVELGRGHRAPRVEEVKAEALRAARKNDVGPLDDPRVSAESTSQRREERRSRHPDVAKVERRQAVAFAEAGRRERPERDLLIFAVKVLKTVMDVGLTVVLKTEAARPASPRATTPRCATSRTSLKTVDVRTWRSTRTTVTWTWVPRITKRE